MPTARKSSSCPMASHEQCQDHGPMPGGITLSVTISKETALKIIDDIMANFPEASQSLRVCNWNYKERKFSIRDVEEADDSTESGCKEYMITEADLLNGFKLMFEPGKWPHGLTFPPASAVYGGTLDNTSPWGGWFNKTDVVDYDAFLQLAVLGEVIYG